MERSPSMTMFGVMLQVNVVRKVSSFQFPHQCLIACTFCSFVAIFFANLTQWKLAPFNLNLLPDQLSIFGRELD